MEKVTAGKEQLGDFAPKFAELNDDVLFGEVWAREGQLSARDRCIVTVTALMASGILDSSLKFHLFNAKKHGVTKEEIAEGMGRVPYGERGMAVICVSVQKGKLKKWNIQR